MSNPLDLTDPVLDASDGPTKLLLAVEYWKQQVKYQISHNKELDRQIDDLRGQLAAMMEESDGRLDEIKLLLAEVTNVKEVQFPKRLGNVTEALKRRIIELEQANSDLAKAAIVPDGMVLVPREPTETMVEACCNSMDRGFAFEYVANAYKAMINAAREYKG